MKKGVVIALFLVFCIGIISALPFISFVNPTPSHGYQTTGSIFTINSTITGVSNLLKFVFNWQSTNYSLYDEDLILMLNLNNNSALGENDSLVYDSSRGEHNGTILGGAEYISSGKYSGAYNFTGGQGINISAHEDFNVDEFTISVWVEKGKELKFKEIVAGGYHTCGILSNGSVMCWGDNTYGSLGDNTTTQKSNPTMVYGNHLFSKITLGIEFTCGLLHNGSALCWGKNDVNQLGDNTTTNKHIPTYVYGNYNFSYIYSLGEFNDQYACGLLHNGSALCWGDGTRYAIGNNDNSLEPIPTPVYGNYSFKSLSKGEGEHTCGILHNGSALCWGQNGNGRLGDNTTTYKAIPNFVYGDYNFSKILTMMDSSWEAKKESHKSNGKSKNPY